MSKRTHEEGRGYAPHARVTAPRRRRCVHARRCSRVSSLCAQRRLVGVCSMSVSIAADDLRRALRRRRVQMRQRRARRPRRALDRLWYGAAFSRLDLARLGAVRYVPLYVGMAGTGAPSSGASSAALRFSTTSRRRAALLSAYVPRSCSPLWGTTFPGGVVVVDLERRSAGTGGSGAVSPFGADAQCSLRCAVRSRSPAQSVAGRRRHLQPHAQRPSSGRGATRTSRRGGWKRRSHRETGVQRATDAIMAVLEGDSRDGGRESASGMVGVRA